VLSNVLLFHECELWVLDELPKADHQTPWIGALSLQPFKEDGTYLFEDDFTSSLCIDKKNDAQEVESVVVWEA